MDARQPGPWHAACCRPSTAFRRCLLFAAVACATLSGCATFWDDITSRDFKFKDMFKPAPDPLWVIRNSNDGDKKSRALRALKEPLQHGGTREQQEVIVQVLTQSAVGDPQPLCRMAAIDSLQHFKDARAAQALIDAYYRAADFKRERAETMATLQCQVLAAIGVNGNPLAVKTLVLIANAPPEGGDDKNKQQDLDQRIAAARALAHFPQYEAAEALVTMLRTEQDVALREPSYRISARDDRRGTAARCAGVGRLPAQIRGSNGARQEAQPHRQVLQADLLPLDALTLTFWANGRRQPAGYASQQPAYAGRSPFRSPWQRQLLSLLETTDYGRRRIPWRSASCASA